MNGESGPGLGTTAEWIREYIASFVSLDVDEQVSKVLNRVILRSLKVLIILS